MNLEYYRTDRYLTQTLFLGERGALQPGGERSQGVTNV